MAENAEVYGRVTNTQGQPEAAVQIRIERLNVGTISGPDGTYNLVVPGSRLQTPGEFTISASRVGLASQSRQLSLTPGGQYTQNFQLESDAMQLE